MYNSAPQLSILVPTYNRCIMLLETLHSILQQSYSDFEVIVTDNCSTDGTADAVAAIRDPRVKYIRNKVNVGAVNNYNRALRAATGQYIYFFSDDDIMLENNLLHKVAVLDQYPSVGLVHSNFHKIDSHGDITSHNHWAANYPPLADIYCALLDRPLMKQAEAFRTLYYGWTFISMPTVLVRASILQTYALELNNQLTYLCDWDLWLKLALKADFYYLPEPLVLYREHVSNESKMLTSQIYYRELVLSKLGTINQFAIKELQGRTELQQVASLARRQLKTMKFYETFTKEQYRYLRGYLKRVLPAGVMQRLRALQ